MKVRKPSVISVLVFILFFVISFISCIMLDEIRQNTKVISASRGYYGKSQIVFAADGASDIDVIESIKKIPSITLYKDNNMNNVRQIHINSKCNNPPLCSGRFFSEKDFSEDKLSENIAVIGKNKVPEAKEVNGQKFIMVYGIPHVVIGVVGMDEEIKLNNTIFVKFNPSLPGISKVYKLDVFSGNEDSIFSDISKEIESKTGSAPKKIVLEKDALERILPEINKKKLYILAIVFLLISSVTISIQWASTLNRKIAVKRLVGCSNFRLAFEIFFDYFKVSLCAGILGVLLSLIFIKEFRLFSMFSVLISVLCGFVVTIPVVKKLLKVSVSEVLAQ